MRKNPRYLLSLLLFASVVLAAPSEPTVQIGETLLQGGLLIGQTEPGNTVEFDGKSVRVSQRGHFLVAAGRDRPNDILIKAHSPAGTTTTVTVSVKGRSYDIQ